MTHMLKNEQNATFGSEKRDSARHPIQIQSGGTDVTLMQISKSVGALVQTLFTWKCSTRMRSRQEADRPFHSGTSTSLTGDVITLSCMQRLPDITVIRPPGRAGTVTTERRSWWHVPALTVSVCHHICTLVLLNWLTLDFGASAWFLKPLSVFHSGLFLITVTK